MKTFRKGTGTLFVIIFVGMVSTAQANKSVFMVSKHNSPSSAQAYAIDGSEVVYQDEVDIGTYSPGNGAVGNAVWPEKELMFVTYGLSASKKCLNGLMKYG